MQALRGLLIGASPWSNGLRLALLNGALIIFCVASFLGTLFLVSSLSLLFPAPLLLMLYAALFLAVWIYFGDRLSGGSRERLKTALIGVLPLLGFGLLGYAQMTRLLIYGDFSADTMLDVGVAMLGFFSTLIILAALICLALITWMGRLRGGLDRSGCSD